MSDDYRSPLSGPFRVFFLALWRWIGGLSDDGVKLLVAGSMIAIATGDFFSQQIGVRLGPLYLLPVCLTCWRFDLYMGLALGFLAAAIVAATTYFVSHGVPAVALLGNLALNAFALGMIAGTMSAARHTMEKERRVARHDSISGALTRRAFERKAARMIQAAAAQGRPLLLAYIDLDGFKIVNDRHGHGAGDLVLKHLGLEGKALLRRDDCFGRMGGDEFAFLMTLAMIEQAKETAEALHGRFTAALVNTAHEVTCSMGALAIPPGSGADFDELLREVDRLMYAAKHGGKNGLRFDIAARPFPAFSASSQSA